MEKIKYRLKKDLLFCENCRRLVESPYGALKDEIVIGTVHPYNQELVDIFGVWVPKKYLEKIEGEK